MSSFREAARAMLLDKVECPKCQARNLAAPASPTIELDVEHDAAVCNQCGTARPLSDFLPQESKR